jgi:dTDP-4-amino-4,6-dideoxygalactose transaminase
MNDFNAEPAELGEAQRQAVQRVLDSGWFILGAEVQNFETQWARYCAASFAVGVGNGMDAIEIGLSALDIGPGAEVITTSMTALATVGAIVRAGATPVLADIDPETALLDSVSVTRCITPRTKALVLVHLYGQITGMAQWVELCASRNIHLVEDCAQAHGARMNGKVAGTFGVFGAFSFYPTKNLGGRGDGGAIITESEQLATRAKVIRNYGQEKRYHHREFGVNSRLDELQAAILSVRLGWLDRWNARRQAIARRYHAGIHNPRIKLLSRPTNPESHVYHLFVVRCVDRDLLAIFLKEQGIETLSHYPIAIHQQTCGRDLKLDPAGLPNAERHASECLSIPCHPHLTDVEVERVITALNRFDL